MTRIAAMVLNADRFGDQYLITVRVGRENYEGDFDGLNFGEDEPRFGSYRFGWLDLVYLHNPGLKAGQPFPLWKISNGSSVPS
jgi:hypothetical protein